MGDAAGLRQQRGREIKEIHRRSSAKRHAKPIVKVLDAAPVAAVSRHDDSFIDFCAHIPALSPGQPVTECRPVSMLTERELCELGCHISFGGINHATPECGDVWRYRRATSA